MADKRKGKKRKEELPFLEEKVEKPSKEEYKIAKWLKKNVSVKRTKFLHHNVEYFTGAKAVDALLISPWSASTNENEEPKFTTRQDVTDYLDQMLRHKFFHRAKKVPVTEQELRAKQKKKKEKELKKDKDKEEVKKEEKEERKRREEETAESSHAEGKESESGKNLQPDEQREKKKMKIRLEMHIDQYFVDSLDAYVWIYDPIPVYYWLFGFLLVIGAILICMFPLWPSSVRMGVYYLSVATAGFLMLIIALAFLRLVIFCLLWMVTLGAHHLWLFPNLTEDVGFFASFWPLYQYEYKGRGSAQKSKKKKKAKDSDNEEEEEEEDEDEDEASETEDGGSSKKQGADDGGGGGGGEGEGGEVKPSATKVRSRRQRVSGSATQSGIAAVGANEEGKEEEGGGGGEEEEDTETESEGSSQQSQTGKDFEIVDKMDVVQQEATSSSSS